MTISLAFLAPDLVKAAIEGRLPHGMGFADFATYRLIGLVKVRCSDCNDTGPRSNASSPTHRPVAGNWAETPRTARIVKYMN